jgi:hypothetical protein
MRAMNAPSFSIDARGTSRGAAGSTPNVRDPTRSLIRRPLAMRLSVVASPASTACGRSRDATIWPTRALSSARCTARSDAGPGRVPPSPSSGCRPRTICAALCGKSRHLCRYLLSIIHLMRGSQPLRDTTTLRRKNCVPLRQRRDPSAERASALPASCRVRRLRPRRRRIGRLSVRRSPTGRGGRRPLADDGSRSNAPGHRAVRFAPARNNDNGHDHPDDDLRTDEHDCSHRDVDADARGFGSHEPRQRHSERATVCGSS